jgi:ribonuclease VapC
MMMIDASAVVAILMAEPAGQSMAEAIEGATAPFTSPLAIYESVVALMRETRISAETADAMVRRLLAEASIRVEPVTDDMATLATRAFERFGKGRHPAALNFGDCFAYACARAHGASLLFVGNDFSRTDIQQAPKGPE